MQIPPGRAGLYASAVALLPQPKKGGVHDTSTWGPFVVNKLDGDAAEISEDADLETWGYDRAEILASLAAAEGGDRHARPGLSRYTLERKLLVQARRLTRAGPVRGLLVSLRRGIDMLLR